MRLYQYVLAIALIGLTPFAIAQEIKGPVKADSGTLCTFTITPPQEAAWTITCNGMDDVSFATDTSMASIYFATINPGKYAVIAAIVVEGKPKQLVARLVIGGEQPNPEPNPEPCSGISNWLKSRVPEAIDSPTNEENSAIANAISLIAERIDRGTIKTVSAAQTRLQIELVSALALAGEKSVLRWNAFLPEWANKITEVLGTEQKEDLTAYKTLLIECENWFAEKTPKNITEKKPAENEPVDKEQPEKKPVENVPVEISESKPAPVMKQVCTPQGCYYITE